MLRLRELREHAGLTQNALSKSAGVRQTTISMLETGKRKMPRVDTVSKLARALGCSVDELVGDDDQQEKNEITASGN